MVSTPAGNPGRGAGLDPLGWAGSTNWRVPSLIPLGPGPLQTFLRLIYYDIQLPHLSDMLCSFRFLPCLPRAWSRAGVSRNVIFLNLLLWGWWWETVVMESYRIWGWGLAESNSDYRVENCKGKQIWEETGKRRREKDSDQLKKVKKWLTT